VASDGERIALERIAKEADDRVGYLDLGMLGLTDLPAELFELKHIRGLNLGSAWRDGSGESWLAARDLGANNVASSLEKLTNLPDLRELWLRQVALITLRGLTGLDSLETIDFSEAEVHDLAPLAGSRRFSRSTVRERRSATSRRSLAYERSGRSLVGKRRSATSRRSPASRRSSRSIAA
jgi:hypothetical protein